MSWAVLAALGGVILIGAATMRATGMGFALVVAPFLVLVLGPFEGILVTNVCGTVSAALNLSQVHRDIDWRRARWVIPAGVIGVIPGAYAVRTLPTAILAIGVSIIVLIGLAFTVIGRRIALPNSPVVAGAGGLASGFMNVTAGVGGPGLVVYALATRWEHTKFAATAQVHFAILGIASLAMKGAVPQMSLAGWVVTASALILGLFGGNLLARRIKAQSAMRLVIVIAGVGAILALLQGIRSL